MSINASVAALGDALVAAGIDRPRPPRDDLPLSTINEAIAPLRLPTALEDFWRLVDLRTLQARAFPGFALPESALESWLRTRTGSPYSEPRHLLLVGYESWNCMWIELADDEQPGGTLFDGRLDAEAFYRRHNRLEDWLDRITELIVSGSTDRVETAATSYLRINDPLDEVPLAAPRDLPPHPLYGTRIAIDREVLSWPAHWQRASGIDPRDAQPRGATHTIAEILGSDPSAELHATVAGRVIDLAGFDTGVRVRVSDGTGSIDIGCPSDAAPFGIASGDRFEFDIAVAAGERRIPADVEAARASTDDPAERVKRILRARYGGPLGGHATAVRPLG
jgi:hypothetical protein